MDAVGLAPSPSINENKILVDVPITAEYVEPELEALGFSEPRWHAEFVDLKAADAADPALPSRRWRWPSRNPADCRKGRAAEKIDVSVNQVTFGSGDMVNYWWHSLQQRRQADPSPQLPGNLSRKIALSLVSAFSD